jgi:AcrR family transcriptional regulator
MPVGRVSFDDVATRAGVGKGTIYLHWRTREALFWAVLQRETLRLLEQLIADLAADAELALPQRLISRLFVELDGRPLVRALLMSDKDVLGALTADESVVAAQMDDDVRIHFSVDEKPKTGKASSRRCHAARRRRELRVLTAGPPPLG